jgi:hypothetical protein
MIYRFKGNAMIQDEALLVRVHFGKYKGWKFREILWNDGYLYWLQNNYTPRPGNLLDEQFKEILGMFPIVQPKVYDHKYSAGRSREYNEDDSCDMYYTYMG